jgi:hypothetical protein
VTRLRAGQLGFDSGKGYGIFLFATASRPALGSNQPPNQCVPGIKRPGREVDHTPLPSAEVKNTWSYPSIPPYVFMAWFLVEHRENFTLIYLAFMRFEYYNLL